MKLGVHKSILERWRHTDDLGWMSWVAGVFLHHFLEWCQNVTFNNILNFYFAEVIKFHDTEGGGVGGGGRDIYMTWFFNALW